MKYKNYSCVFVGLITVALSCSCSKERSLKDELVGKWTVNSEETVERMSGALSDSDVEMIKERFSKMNITYTHDFVLISMQNGAPVACSRYSILETKPDQLIYEEGDGNIIEFHFLSGTKAELISRAEELPFGMILEKQATEKDKSSSSSNMIKKLAGTWTFDYEASAQRAKVAYDGELEDASANDATWETMTFLDSVIILTPQNGGNPYPLPYMVREEGSNYIIIKPVGDGISKITFIEEDKIEFVGDEMVTVLVRKER